MKTSGTDAARFLDPENFWVPLYTIQNAAAGDKRLIQLTCRVM